MWLVGYTPQQKADVTPINIGIDPVTPRPGKDFTVDATILNQGDADAGSFSVSLYANDVLKDTESVLELNKDDSTTVSFTNVNLPEGCYELKVVADVYGEVDESDEYNNESTEYCQVGYVIVVESDSDFATLAADPGMPTGSVTYDSGTDTYYIQDLTITNCAGDGIFIEGTTKNFVIKNCMIENCAPDASGVFLNDMTKGTITECTLQNNEAYGIELGLVPLDSEDPKFINITCNTIYQNGMSADKNGIDLIGTDCIVKYNRVIDNGAYGIYVYGNDNKIHNNTIEDNDDYGIKLYSSSGNDIYQNDLSNNNGGGVQGYDDMTVNTWRTPTQVNYPYKCSNAWYSYTGNYWNDHRDASDPDGIMDSPYALDGGSAQDYYPLSVEWRLCGDANRDGDVNMMDAGVMFGSIFHPESVTICNPWAANVNGDSGIDMMDAGAMIGHIFQDVMLNSCCKDC
jgi:parallel beta-helix repeat protein